MTPSGAAVISDKEREISEVKVEQTSSEEASAPQVVNQCEWAATGRDGVNHGLVVMFTVGARGNVESPLPA